MEKITHLDLFSGIGGAALAVEAVWPDNEHIFCEIDPYCQALLKKRFPNSQIYGDIRTLTANSCNPRLQGDEQPSKDAGTDSTRQTSASGTIAERATSIDILTGGFPCQPFSQAGRRKGTSDDRHLWPEMLRVIREFRPKWIVGENVAGLLTIEQGLVFEQVCADLEAEGYEVQSFVIPAVAVGAPHRRDRVWIVGHDDTDTRGKRGSRRGIHQDGKLSKRILLPTIQEDGGATRSKVRADIASPERNFANPEGAGQPGWTYGSGKVQFWGSGAGYDWLEVATELCRVDDGLPAELDGLKLSKSKHRSERLKGLGNAWVPQVAIEIFKGIKQINQW